MAHQKVYWLLASEDEAPVSVVCRRQVRVSRLVNAMPFERSRKAADAYA